MSRTAILSRIRSGLGAEAQAPGRRETVADRLAEPERQLTPQRALLPKPELRAQFAQFLKAQFAEVIEVDAPGAIPEAIAGYLRQGNLPARLRHGSDPFFATLPWGEAPGLEHLSGRAEGDDIVGLSRAVAGAAETGTLVLASGADNPVTLAFVPEVHIVLVAAEDIIGPYEDAFNLVRQRCGRREMPRTLNLISGASRTADIGGKIVIGAHGPKQLCVIVYGAGKA